MTDRETVLALLHTIRRAWREGRVAELGPLFHAEMAITGPDLAPRCAGREACAASYGDFLTYAKVLAYHEAEHDVSIFGDTAVGRFRWEMTWEADGKAMTEQGRDLWVFARSAGAWQAVFRSMLPTQA